MFANIVLIVPNNFHRGWILLKLFLQHSDAVGILPRGQGFSDECCTPMMPWSSHFSTCCSFQMLSLWFPLPEVLWEQSTTSPAWCEPVKISHCQQGLAKTSSKPALRIAERPQCHCRSILFSCSVLRFWTWCELAHLHYFCSKVTSELFTFHFLPLCQFYEDQTLMLV